MKSYVWVAFAFMGWTYYEMSGGSEFEPEAAPLTAAAPVVEEAPLELAARADTTVLQSVSTSNVTDNAAENAASDQLILASAEAQTTYSEEELAAAIEDALDLQKADDVAGQVADVTSVVAPTQELTGQMADIVAPSANPLTGDIRAVSGSRVNMRTGPGTDYGVIDTLAGGTQVEVLEVDANGWARLIHLDSGAEGWMAERLLTDPS